MVAEVILVIEDDVHIGGLVVQVLREAGFAPALVRDVRAARDWAAEGNAPAAVVSDLMVAATQPGALTAALRDLLGRRRADDRRRHAGARRSPCTSGS